MRDGVTPRARQERDREPTGRERCQYRCARGLSVCAFRRIFNSLSIMCYYAYNMISFLV